MYSTQEARGERGAPSTATLPPTTAPSRRRRLPAFANLQEALLENMIQNILVEASRGEVVLTSRPRVIALPPLSVSRWGRPPRRRGARGAGRAGLAPGLPPTSLWGFLSSRVETPDLLPVAPLGLQQAEVPRPAVPPPATL